MQPHTKKRPIEDAHLLVVACPGANMASVMDFLKNNGCDVNDTTSDENDEPVPVEIVSPNRTPGTILRGYRYRDGLTQAELSGLVGIPRHHISEMENNKRPIGKQTARKLANVFKTDPRMFIWV